MRKSEKSAVDVSIRIRPVLNREKGFDQILTNNSTVVSIVNPLDKKKLTSFEFNRIYGQETTQDDVFNTVGEKVLKATRDGYNSCILAYGQSGCFRKGTEVLIHTIDNATQKKKVENITLADKLVGFDFATNSRSVRNVCKLYKGYQRFYKVEAIDISNYISNESVCGITRDAFEFFSYYVNYDHIMTIKEINNEKAEINNEKAEINNEKAINVPINQLKTNTKYAGYICSEFKAYEYQFIIKELPEEEYFGFAVDADNRFLLANGILVHNSGKTHCMIGSEDNPGLVPRLCDAIFNLNPNVKCTIEFSYIEIYSEVIRDLMTPSLAELKVREHPEIGVYVDGLKKLQANNVMELLVLIEKGNRERVVASTALNDRSSRSHAIIIIYYSQHGDRQINSKINLVDLAGSEKIEISKVTGQNAKEAISINTSLTQLGIVIQHLAKKQQASHIPFRNSKLTHVLKDSIGGNSKTFMIATVSPSSINYDETINTLRYATNAGKIVNMVCINEGTDANLIKQLERENAQLKLELRNKNATPEEINRLKQEILEREHLIKQLQKTSEQKEVEKREILRAEEEKRVILEQRHALELYKRQQENDATLREMEQNKINMTKEFEQNKIDMAKDFEQKKNDLEQNIKDKAAKEYEQKQYEFVQDKLSDVYDKANQNFVQKNKEWEVKLQEYKDLYDQQTHRYEALKLQYKEQSTQMLALVEKTASDAEKNNKIAEAALKENAIRQKEQLIKETRMSQLTKQVQQMQAQIHALTKAKEDENSDYITLQAAYDELKRTMLDLSAKYNQIQTKIVDLKLTSDVDAIKDKISKL